MLDQKERGVSFEQAQGERDGLLDVLEHPNSRYPHQKQFIILLHDYVYVVPYVDTYFLKTIYPSRKLTKKYLRQGED